jgi:hypothetical protein
MRNITWFIISKNSIIKNEIEKKKHLRKSLKYKNDSLFASKLREIWILIKNIPIEYSC